ncbi:unnamed protein product [Closterium sp. NIES-53]
MGGPAARARVHCGPHGKEGSLESFLTTCSALRALPPPCSCNTSSPQLLLMENDIDARPFSQQVLACLPPLPWSVSPLDVTDPRTKREDLRHMRVFSVDPIGCRDIDDALHCVPLPNGNFDVGVHIADVTNFVLPGTPLDVEASQRGTSVYLVERRIDMLPKPLTEGRPQAAQAAHNRWKGEKEVRGSA